MISLNAENSLDWVYWAALDTTRTLVSTRCQNKIEVWENIGTKIALNCSEKISSHMYGSYINDPA